MQQKYLTGQCNALAHVRHHYHSSKADLNCQVQLGYVTPALKVKRPKNGKGVVRAWHTERAMKSDTKTESFKAAEHDMK